MPTTSLPVLSTASSQLLSPTLTPAPSNVVMTEVPDGARIYVSVQGDWWDTIAMRAYGFKRGNERLMYRLIEANYALRTVSHFPAGVQVIVPQIEVATEIPLVPWKSVIVTP